MGLVLLFHFSHFLLITRVACESPLDGIQGSQGQGEKFLNYSPRCILVINTNLFFKGNGFENSLMSSVVWS